MTSDIVDMVSTRLKKQQPVSPERRRYLEQLAQLMSRNYDPQVSFRGITTARCRHENGEMKIDICSDMIDQVVTNLDEQVWSLVAQEGLLIHEMGHVLYTDFDAHSSIKDKLGMSEMNAFHDIVWNSAEDAAIEEQLRWKFNCSRELDTYNANIFARQKTGARNLRIPQAVKIAILEKGCYDAGAVEEHLSGERQLVRPQDADLFDDKVLPEVNDMLADVMTEPDPEARYERMLEFWDWLKDIMADELGTDATSEAKSGKGDGYGDAKPDDTSGMTPGELADALEDLDEGEVRDRLEQIAQPQQNHDWDDILDEDGDENADEQEDDSDELGDLFGGGGSDEDVEDGDSTDGADSADSPSEAEDDPDGGAEEESEHSDEQGGSGGSQPGGDGPGYPSHEGHRLVIRD